MYLLHYLPIFPKFLTLSFGTTNPGKTFQNDLWIFQDKDKSKVIILCF